MEQRRHPRRNITLEVELSYPGREAFLTTSRDISESGMFLFVDQERKPGIGEVVAVQLVEQSAGMETLPAPDAVVVRHTPEGIGIAFIEMDFFDDE